MPAETDILPSLTVARAFANMTTRLPFKTTFEPERVIQPIFTGGSVALDNGARILATALGEDAVLTDLATGRQYAKIEGVRETIARNNDG